MAPPTTRSQHHWQSDMELLEDLGQGAFGCVIHCRKHGKEYAIKMIDYNCEQSRKYADRELRIHKSLSSGTTPGVVRLHAHYFISKPHDTLCLVLEYCPQTLSSKIRAQPHGRLSEEDAAGYFAQIAQTIQTLHHKNIMHRDIKPSNILLAADEKTTKLADFGISTTQASDGGIFHQQTQSKSNTRNPARMTMIGTRGYTAPEIEKQILKRKKEQTIVVGDENDKENGADVCPMNVDVDTFDDVPPTGHSEQSYDSIASSKKFLQFPSGDAYSKMVDVWSLGATLYAMVTGDLSALRDYNSGQDDTGYLSYMEYYRLDNIDEGIVDWSDIDLPDFLSDNAKDLISRLLEEDPQSRISLDQVLQHPFLNV